jgi:hypothetical protein
LVSSTTARTPVAREAPDHGRLALGRGAERAGRHHRDAAGRLPHDARREGDALVLGELEHLGRLRHREEARDAGADVHLDQRVDGGPVDAPVGRNGVSMTGQTPRGQGWASAGGGHGRGAHEATRAKTPSTTCEVRWGTWPMRREISCAVKSSGVTSSSWRAPTISGSRPETLQAPIDLAAAVEDRGAEAVGAELVLLVVDGVAALAGALEVGGEGRGVDDRVGVNRGSPRRRTISATASGVEGAEDGLPDRGAVHGPAIADGGARQEAAPRLDRVDVEDVVGLERGEVDGLVGGVGELAQQRGRAVAQLDADARGLGERHRCGAESVPVAVDALDVAVGGQGLEDVVDGALGEVEPAGQVGQRERGSEGPKASSTRMARSTDWITRLAS